MVFDNIFSAARGASNIGDMALNNISSFIPHNPAESVCVPPHDPSLKRVESPQDPKIVRETSPAAQAIFNFISGLTQSIGETSKQQNDAFNDPSTTVGSASPITKTANNETKSYPKDTQKPEVDVGEFLESSRNFKSSAKDDFPKKQ